eukprot:12911320-Prorocentrum_lima.AAC.1
MQSSNLDKSEKQELMEWLPREYPGSSPCNHPTSSLSLLWLSEAVSVSINNAEIASLCSPFPPFNSQRAWVVSALVASFGPSVCKYAEG